MTKSKILTIIAIVIAIAILVIIGVLIFNNNTTNQPQQEIININKNSTNVQPDTFKAVVIAVDANKIVIAANEDTAIAQANNTRIIDVLYNTNTQILQAGEVKDITAVQVGQEITISYDGNIIITSPITINADKIEF